MLQSICLANNDLILDPKSSKTKHDPDSGKQKKIEKQKKVDPNILNCKYVCMYVCTYVFIFVYLTSYIYSYIVTLSLFKTGACRPQASACLFS